MFSSGPMRTRAGLTWIPRTAVRTPVVARYVLDQILQCALVAGLLPFVQDRSHVDCGLGGVEREGSGRSADGSLGVLSSTRQGIYLRSGDGGKDIRARMQWKRCIRLGGLLSKDG